MKPIGGIITSKKSIPDNFRQVETFTTEYLSKLWKIYTINRDVLDKGRRLENLFWRIWGSERIKRNFSGRTVSQIFAKILEGESGFELRIPPRPVRAALPPPSSPSFVANIESLSSPRPSLEIECPPTPPPSPIPPPEHSIVGFQVGSNYLSKPPSQTAITASIRRKFPDAPPSPPIPYRSPALVSMPIEPIEEVEVVSSQQPQQPMSSKSTLTVTIVANAQVNPDGGDAASYSTVGSGSESSEGPKASKARKPKSDRPPPRGRRKIVATKASTTKAAAGRTTAALKKTTLRPALPKRKSSSSSNTAVNTAASSPSNTLTVDVARSLPSSSQQRQERKRNSLAEGNEEEGRKGDTIGSGWVVDPDFRTKYLEQKNKEKLGTLTKAISTIAASEAATKVSRRVKGKNVRVVDEIVPLKGLSEDMGDAQVAPIVSIRDIEAEEQTVLPRRKSELTLLFEREGAKKAGAVGAVGIAEKNENGRERGTKKVQAIIEGKVRR